MNQCNRGLSTSRPWALYFISERTEDRLLSPFIQTRSRSSELENNLCKWWNLHLCNVYIFLYKLLLLQNVKADISAHDALKPSQHKTTNKPTMSKNVIAGKLLRGSFHCPTNVCRAFPIYSALFNCSSPEMPAQTSSGPDT